MNTQGLKQSLIKIYYCVLWILKIPYRSLLHAGYKLKWFSVYHIPVIINNFNRLTYPLQLIEFLERCGFTNIIILDNNSSYSPLIEYYRNCKHKVIRSNVNYGHLAFWKSGLYNRYKWNYFVYTDSDVVPLEDCPTDFIEYFKRELDHRPGLEKIGFGIRIDDLPDSFVLKKQVVDYEKKYWQKEVKPNLFDAPVDTTFALYKPFSNLRYGEVYTLPALRTGFPYVVRHMPWYVDSENLSVEEDHYIRSCNSSSSIGQQLTGSRVVY